MGSHIEIKAIENKLTQDTRRAKIKTHSFFSMITNIQQIEFKIAQSDHVVKSVAIRSSSAEKFSKAY